MLERLPRGFQEDPLLGIQGGRFARRDAKESSIESIDILEKPSVARVHLAGHVWVGVVQLIDVPAIGRDFGYGVFAVLKKPPHRIGARNSAGKTATDADNGDRLVPRVLHRRETCLHLVERGERLLQNGTAIGLIRPLGHRS